MDVSIKTTIYDIFGYLMPGLLSISCIYAFYKQAIDKSGIIDAFAGIFNGWNVYSCAALVGVAYLVGHFISTLSSLVFEKWTLHEYKLFSEYWELEKILDNNTYIQLSKKYEKVFKIKANKDEKFFRKCLVYVEAKQPAIYSTAFVFMSFYGMARSIALIALGFAVWTTVYIGIYSKQCIGMVYGILALIVFAVFMQHYLRFQRYFRQHILSGFLLPEKEDKKEDEKEEEKGKNKGRK